MANPSLILLQTDPSTWPNPDAGKTFVGTNSSGQLVTKVHDGSPAVVASGDPSLSKQASSDTTPVAVVPTTPFHTEIVTVTGAARTLPVLLGGTDQPDGARCTILFNLPATSGIVVEIYDDATLISVIENQSDGAQKASVEFYLDAGAWKVLREVIPAFTPVP